MYGVYVRPQYWSLRVCACGDDWKNIIARINHGRTSGGARMYLGLSGLDYTLSRWARVSFREFYNGDTCENFWSTRHGYLRSIPAERVESRFNRRRHSDRHGVNLTRYAPPSTSSCFYCMFPRAHVALAKRI